MPHGTPDWWGENPTATVHQVTDSGELAVRLGSPDSYDRRGNVVWLDDFQAGFGRWYTAVSGTGGHISLSALYPGETAYSVKLCAGSSLTHNATMIRYGATPVAGKTGLEVAFSLDEDAEDIRLYIDYDDGVDRLTAGVKWVEATQKLYLYTTGPVWTEIDASKPLDLYVFSFHHLKLVVDLENAVYSRVLLDQDEYPVSAYAPEIGASVQEGRFYGYIWFTGDAGVNGVCYIDAAILTQNEP